MQAIDPFTLSADQLYGPITTVHREGHCQGTPNPTLAPQPLSVNMLCLEAFPSVTFL